MILRWRNREYIEEKYTHKGLVFGLLPIWLRVVRVEVDGEAHVIIDDRDSNSEFPAMEERNGIPKLLFYIVSALYGAWLYSAFAMEWEIPAPIVVYGEV